MDFTKLGTYIDSLEKVGVPGCDVAVYQDHKEIYRHMAGYSDPEGTQPVQGDETYCLYSCTKLFTTCAAMQLIEKGLLSPDDPVSRYLPAYADMTVKAGENAVPAKNVMTIRHLMSMQSGLDYELDTPQFRAVLDKTGGHATTRELADALASRPLQFEPGSDFLYSLSHDVLAAVIEVISGQQFSDYLKENIFAPLGLDVIGFTLTEEQMAKLCAQYKISDETGERMLIPGAVDEYALSDRHESGGAGLMSNVHDYITFADVLACGGRTKEGRQILTPEMIQLWSANQLGPKARRTFDEWNRLGYSYALGVRTRVDLTKGGPGSVGEFGWDGAAGSWVMIDPYRHISAFYAMHVKNFAYCYDVIHPTIRTLIYEGMEA